jgi:hypothetical protein
VFALVTLVAGLAILLVIHTLTPSRRWPAAAAALIAAMFARAWIVHWMDPSSLGFGDYSVQTFAELTVGFAIAVLSYFGALLYVPADEPVARSVHA